MSTDPIPSFPQAWRPGDTAPMARRDFLRLTGLTSLAVFASSRVAVAGPFVREDFKRLIPLDKKLSADWLAGLTARGVRETYSGTDLRFIGMPVGGLFCGTLYLGGDGRLWLWDIFNRTGEGVEPKGGCLNGKTIKPRDGGAYVDPLVAADYCALEQGFSLTVKTPAGEVTRSLDSRPASGCREVTFSGEYPIGVVTYGDPALPVSVKLEAFSPFIPLNAADSSLPATVFSFTIKNEKSVPVEIVLKGVLENAVLRAHKNSEGERRIDTLDSAGMTFLNCEAQSVAGEGDAAKLPDAGSMGLALLGPPAEIRDQPDTAPLRDRLTGSLGRKLKLAPGEVGKIDFVLTWHFPNVPKILGGKERHYAAQFPDAQSVAAYVVQNFTRLAGQTRLWRDTWYDSTLPFWFLNRTFANTSILATNTVYRFRDGRLWAWEGIGCCPGTCTHVWHYAQAMGRIFPEVERDHRERVDFGLGFDKGVIKFRAENGATYAVDGQAGRILCVLREHQMSRDDAFLRRLWPKVKMALERIMKTDAADGKPDGLICGPLHNTLDANWYGIVPWLCGIYHAALRAGEVMAAEVGDAGFAAKCHEILAVASRNLDEVCWNADYNYYTHQGDVEHATEVGAYDGCHIDQVLGQSWAWQVGLGDVMTGQNVQAALKSLWKYNFTPDVGPFRAAKKEGRWYAMPGEGGLIMLSNPFAADIEFTGKSKWTTMYFNECMSGFEHQAASHMIWEGLVTEGLAVTRSIHERYSPRRRNPYNEVECSDHYARAMASYGSFTAACGFECHGPKGHIGFAPRLTPAHFKAAFISAEGWGTFSQEVVDGAFHAALDVKWGQLNLKTLGLVLPEAIRAANRVAASVGAQSEPVTLSRAGSGIMLTFATRIGIAAGEKLTILIC